MDRLIYRVGQLLPVLLLITHLSWGQAGSTEVSIKVVAYYQGEDGDGVGQGWNEYRWNFSYKGTSICVEEHAKDPGWWYDEHEIVNEIKHDKVPGYDSDNPALCITMESWEEDEGDNCSYSSGDDNHYGPNGTVAVYDLYREQPPGISTGSVMRKAFTYNTNNRVTYEFYYTPPEPSVPGINKSSSNLCVNDDIVLSTETYVYPSFLDQVHLNWEYWIVGDYYTVFGLNIPRWQSLGSTTIASDNGGNKTISLKDLPELENLTDRQEVHFRVRSWANDAYGSYSDVSSIAVDPVGPSFTAAAIQPSCSVEGTGKIRVQVTGNGTGKYRLDYTKVGGDTFTVPGGVTTNDYTLNNLESGTYTLRLSNYRNNAPFLSACDMTQTVTVGTVSNISWNSSSQSYNPGCSDGTGSIYVEVNGGNSDKPIVFRIADGPPVSNKGQNYNKANFSNLPAGTYTVTATDPCNGTSLSKSFTLTAPPKIVASVSTVNPKCDNPDDGKIRVNISNGPGRYDYELWKGSSRIATKSNTTNVSHTFSSLSAGNNYEVRVYDHDRRSCLPFQEEAISLGFTPLSISSFSKNDMRCAGETGTVKAKAGGGSGAYQYTLAHASGSYNQSNTNGSFTVNRGGNYTLTVKNSGSACSDVISKSLNITAPSPLTLTISQQNIICSGAYDGKLTAAVNGGTAPYTYQWQERESVSDSWYNYAGSGAVSHQISQLYDARYRLIVTDKNGCQLTSDEHILTDPEELVIDEINVEHVSCKGANDGQILPLVSGGWSDYIFTYREEAQTKFTPFTEQSLFAPGNYHIRISDREGCTLTYPEILTITEPLEALSLQHTVSEYNGYQVSCFGGNDGWVEASAIGGNGNPFGNQYWFALDEGNFSTESIFTGLTAGIYELKVKDERGCVFTQSVKLNSPEKLILTTKEKNYIRCFGDSTGYITVEAEGGVGPYLYRMGTSEWQDSPTFSQLPSGTYSLTAKDSQECLTVFTESITTNNPLVISFNKTDVRCYEENNGEITATISGGKAPYHLLWKETASSDAHIDQLAPAWYTLSVVDAEGCVLIDSVQIQEPTSALYTTPLVTPVRCFDEENGQIAILSDGGTPPYRYSIDGGATFQSDSLFKQLLPGTYTTITEDSRGCAFTAEAAIMQPDTLVLSLISKTDILCHAESSGMIEVAASGGTQAYRYSLDEENWQDSPLFTELIAGNYQIHLQDTRGCQASLSVTLSEPDAPLQLSYETIPVQCKGTASGSIATTVIGGTPPYTYRWHELSANTAMVSGLLQGDYVLTVTDAHACQLVDTIAVTEPEVALQASMFQQINVSCYGLSDGFVEVEALGGYPPYQYSWQGEAFSDVTAYDKLSAGNYQVTVRDTMGCEVKVDIYVSQPDMLTATPEVVQYVSCFGASDAQFQANVNGGTPPYRYSLDEGISWQQEALFTGYPIGQYTMLVEDSLACQSLTLVDITEPSLLTATIENVVEAACTQANGEARLIVNGGTPPYLYQWINQKRELISEEVHPINLAASVYDVYVRDAKNCMVHLTQVINDLDGPVSEIVGRQDASCFTSSDGRATVEATGGSGTYQYVWNDPLVQTSPTATQLARGKYFVTVTDERGCVSISSVTIGSPEAFRIDTLHWEAPTCYEACDGQLELKISGGVTPYTYQWEGRSETAPTLTNLCRGEYTLTVTDASGCSLSQEFSMSPPDSLQLELISSKAPTCFQGCDGQAAIAVQGGTAPYQYQWSDVAGQTNAQAENLCSGTYKVTVTDTQGCQAQQTVVIEEAPQIAVQLPDTVTLCLDQSVTLDASIPQGQYQWTHNGSPLSTDAYLTVDQAGTYQVRVTNEQGCHEVAQTEVLTYDTLFEVNFLQTSELIVGDTLTLTEVCFPLPDSVHWHFPPEADILNASSWEPQITFEEADDYQITLVGYYSVCTDSITKTVAFFPPQKDLNTNARLAQGSQGIKSVMIFPNPTNGRFQVEVTLYSVTSLFAFINDTNGQEIGRIQQKDSDTYSFEFDISRYASGQYYLRLMTQYDQKAARILLR
ncbi:T9SS type A sorting domain-containing protein [Catalinimonas sp. 4WD22]|uniref:T9SS type A sorting domain-containing protein n=1 Tax=Catalinimonas locisalis TaxID=3133978 RepID=UPI003100AF30